MLNNLSMDLVRPSHSQVFLAFGASQEKYSSTISAKASSGFSFEPSSRTLKAILFCPTTGQNIDTNQNMELLHAQAERLRGMESHFPSEDALREEEAQWRRYGRARRKELLEIDETRGGTQFKMNVSCSVHRYFQVANRVSFLQVCTEISSHNG